MVTVLDAGMCVCFFHYFTVQFQCYDYFIVIYHCVPVQWLCICNAA